MICIRLPAIGFHEAAKEIVRVLGAFELARDREALCNQRVVFRKWSNLNTYYYIRSNISPIVFEHATNCEACFSQFSGNSPFEAYAFGSRASASYSIFFRGHKEKSKP